MTPAEKQQSIELIKQGVSTKVVAELLGFARCTINRTWRLSGEKFRPVDYKGCGAVGNS